jgi:large subunit ribosomal protein L17
MRHHVFGKQLGRSMGQRTALRRTLITQLFEHERITTTKAKAQAIRAEAEHMITQAKRSVASNDPARIVFVRRLLNGRLNSTEVTQKIFDVFAPRYAERPGGYTRVLKLGMRKGDAAEMVILELVDSDRATKTSGDQAQAATPASGARGLLNRIRGGQAAKPADAETGSAAE